MAQVSYQIILKDLQDNIIGEIDRFKNLSFNKVLNREGDFSFDMNLLDLKANPTYINHRQIQVFIYRNGQVAFGGFMLADDGTADWQQDTFTLRGKGFFEVFQHRYTDPSNIVEYNQDAGLTAWQLINTSQGLSYGNVGITLGTLESTITLDQVYHKQQIYQAILDMGSDNIDGGYEFEVTQTKVLNIKRVMGTDQSANVSFQGGTNIHKVQFAHDHANPTNQAIVQGQGQGFGTPIVIVDDIALQQNYGLLQGLISAKNAVDPNVLTGKGQRLISKYGIPRRQYTMYQTPGSNPDWTTLNVGDYVRVDLDRGFLSIHDKVRITSIGISYQDGVEVPQYIFLYN